VKGSPLPSRGVDVAEASACRQARLGDRGLVDSDQWKLLCLSMYNLGVNDMHMSWGAEWEVQQLRERSDTAGRQQHIGKVRKHHPATSNLELRAHATARERRKKGGISNCCELERTAIELTLRTTNSPEVARSSVR
jgi:hypothetical protein